VPVQREREHNQRYADQEAWVPAAVLVNDPGLPHTTHASQDTPSERAPLLRIGADLKMLRP